MHYEYPPYTEITGMPPNLVPIFVEDGFTTFCGVRKRASGAG